MKQYSLMNTYALYDCVCESGNTFNVLDWKEGVKKDYLNILERVSKLAEFKSFDMHIIDVRNDDLRLACSYYVKCLEDELIDKEEASDTSCFSIIVTYALCAMYEQYGYPTILFGDSSVVIPAMYWNARDYVEFFKNKDMFMYPMECMFECYVDSKLEESRIKLDDNDFIQDKIYSKPYIEKHVLEKYGEERFYSELGLGNPVMSAANTGSAALSSSLKDAMQVSRDFL